MNYIIQAVGILLMWIQLILESIVSLFQGSRKTEYDADFLPTNEILSRFNKGICINGKSLSLEDSYKNVLLLGQTGSGKSTCVSIPTCLNLLGNASLLVNDPSGEISKTVSGAFKSAGYEVKIINYTKPEYGGYNPLHRVRTRTDIHKISEQIIYTSLGRGKDPFWSIASASCLNIFIELVCSFTEPFRTMHTVISLINTYSFNPGRIDRLVIESNIQELIDEYKTFNSFDQKVIQNILASVKAATKVYTDPLVAQCTAFDTASFEQCRKKPTIIFFNNSISAMQYYGSITSIFFEQFFAELLDTPPAKGDLPVFCIIDEASSLYLKSLQITVSNIRKSKGGILAIYQSYHQIISLYGHDEAQALRDNCFTTVYLPGQPLDVAKEISTTLGSFEFIDERGMKQKRLLVTPDEVHQLETCLVLAGNRRAVKMEMKPYYNSFRFSRLTNMPPYIPENQMPFETIPIMKISEDEPEN